MNYAELVSEFERLNITPKMFKNMFDQSSDINDLCDNCLLSEVFGPISLIKIGNNDCYTFLKTGINVNIYVDKNIYYMQECVVVKTIETLNDLLPFLENLEYNVNNNSHPMNVLYNLKHDEKEIYDDTFGKVSLVDHTESNIETGVYNVSRVLYFHNIEKYILFEGIYSSYGGYEYSNWKLVTPKLKTITVYE